MTDELDPREYLPKHARHYAEQLGGELTDAEVDQIVEMCVLVINNFSLGPALVLVNILYNAINKSLAGEGHAEQEPSDGD